MPCATRVQGEPHVCQKANDKPPTGDRYSGEPHVFVSADTRLESSNLKSEIAKVRKNTVLNLGHLYFDIVSVLELRISYFSYRDTLHASRDTSLSSTSVEDSLQIISFMQNKPNFQKSQMNVNPYNTTDYEEKSNWTLGENKPNSNPIKPNLPDSKIDAKCVLTKDYEEKCG